MKFYMHQRIIGENLIKIGLILSAQWRFSEERYQACPVTLKFCGTPLQRFTSSLQLKIDEKLEAKQKLVDQGKDLKTRIDDAKLMIAGAGPVCHNCHMRLRHTSRNCTFEHCEAIYSCGQEKLHPAEFAELKQIRQSINKLEKEIQHLSRDMENRIAAVSKVKDSVTKRIESELLEEDEESYTENGFRNWQHIAALAAKAYICHTVIFEKKTFERKNATQASA